MNQFLRALRDAIKRWPFLLGAFLCSACVAGLWGANIAALFPVIEVTLNGESLQSWNGRRLSDAEHRISAAIAEASALETSLASNSLGSAEGVKARSRIDTLVLNRRGDEAVVYSARKLEPWLDRFLPADPFQTVLLVVGLIVVSTFLKHVFMLAGTMMVGWVAMNISRDLRLRVFDKAIELDRAQFMRHGSAGFMSQLTHTTDMLAGGITAVYGGAVTEPEPSAFHGSSRSPA